MGGAGAMGAAGPPGDFGPSSNGFDDSGLGHGAGMTETNGNSAGESGQDGDGLFASAENALPKIIRSKITARWRADDTLQEPKTVLTELVDRIE